MNNGVTFHRGKVSLFSAAGQFIKEGSYQTYFHRKKTIERWHKEMKDKDYYIQIRPNLYVHKADFAKLP